MTAPRRIQRKRTRGWRMPEGAIYVGRPTRWGNPFPWQGDWIVWTAVALGHRADAAGRRTAAVDLYRAWMTGAEAVPVETDDTGGSLVFEYGSQVSLVAHTRSLAAVAAALTGTLPTLPAERPSLAPLRGHDLACWCPPGEPCHADVLLELANRLGWDGQPLREPIPCQEALL